MRSCGLSVVIVGLLMIGVAALWFLYQLVFPIKLNSGAGPSWTGEILGYVAMLGLIILAIGLLLSGRGIATKRDETPPSTTGDMSRTTRE